MIAWQIRWGHEDAEVLVPWPSLDASLRRAKKNQTAASRACDTPHPCSCSGCGNPRRVGWEKRDRATWQEHDHELKFQESLADYKIKEGLYEDYWDRPGVLMPLWSGKHPDLTDTWDWDEIDFAIMETYRNEQ